MSDGPDDLGQAFEEAYAQARELSGIDFDNIDDVQIMTLEEAEAAAIRVAEFMGITPRGDQEK